jgi:hypothetical protein
MNLVALCSGVVLLACQQPAPTATTTSKADEASVAAERAYPPGRWRDRIALLNDYYVSLAHIFITHNQSNTLALASYWPWTGDWPSHPRTRDDAFELANKLSSALRSNEATFESAVAQWSEDPITRSYDGNYGVIRSPNLMPELLDAYETLSDGEVSKPIESLAGYHIIKRVPVPAEEHLWSRRLTVMYAPVAGWERKGRTITRTREEARQLAAELSQRARAKPDEFIDLIAKYSDDISAEVGGDAGPSSNLGGKLDVATRQTLARLEPMEISEALDELTGFTIVQRLPERALDARAFDSFTVPFEGELNGAPVHRSVDEARALSEQVARDLATRPSQFAAAKAQFCAEERCESEGPLVTDGSSYPTIYRRLAELSIGEVSVRPEPCPVGMLVYQRVAVPATATAAPRVLRIDASETAKLTFE